MPGDQNSSIYHAVPGGSDLVRWFGQVPSFHDAEVLSLHLRRKGPSVLSLHSWIMKRDHEGFIVLDKHAVVKFTLTGIMDLELGEFSSQNVIRGLTLRRALDRPERRCHLALSALPEDIEIALESCFGLHGLIRARSVAIAFQPGKPDEQDH